MQNTGTEHQADPHADWLDKLDQTLMGQLRFLVEADRLKSVVRGSPLADRTRRENSAEHSWHLALFAIVLGRWADGAPDINRVVTMLLIHDLVEIECGDTPLFDEAGAAEQAHREKLAAERVFGWLPPEQGAELHALWQEFEAASTPEARFAKALDRLQPMLQNHLARGGTWLDYDVDIAREARLTQGIQRGSQALWQAAQTVMDDAVAQGWLRPDHASSTGG